MFFHINYNILFFVARYVLISLVLFGRTIVQYLCKIQFRGLKYSIRTLVVDMEKLMKKYITKKLRNSTRGLIIE